MYFVSYWGTYNKYYYIENNITNNIGFNICIVKVKGISNKQH